MTRTIHFDPARTHHPLRRALPASVACYRAADAPSDPGRWRRDVRDFTVTFAVTFVGVLTLFG